MLKTKYVLDKAFEPFLQFGFFKDGGPEEESGRLPRMIPQPSMKWENHKAGVTSRAAQVFQIPLEKPPTCAEPVALARRGTLQVSQVWQGFFTQGDLGRHVKIPVEMGQMCIPKSRVTSGHDTCPCSSGPLAT